MIRRYTTTGDDWAIFIGSHVILLILFLLGMAMAQ